ncbi:uncharacterized protein DEA37_0015121 [Paragonimus westermani]|uniref:Uncharacterized protein n=1 Tax=Paragonimus westermani TaxID=34504 RepID=A0A5J4NF56_9TREM|nr:uncharacterized protein DEA37_0015121 [Paragonimus westermani]
MNDDSDAEFTIFGKTATQINDDLAHRDTIIKHGLISDLQLSSDADTATPQSVNDYLEASTPWTRLQSLFFSPSLLQDTELSKMGRKAKRMPLVIGGIVAFTVSTIRLVSAYDEFVRSNALTAWRTPEIAKRRAADYSMLKALTLGMSTGIKAVVLTAGCYTFPLVLTAILGKSSFWENAVGWGSACCLYCINRGRRQMLVAGLIAGVPGLFYGSVNLLVARKLDLTFEDMYRAYSSTLVQRNLQKQCAMGPDSSSH